MEQRKVILIIMDGWGIPTDPSVSAIDAASTPFYDESLHNRPHSRLQASEEAVGLPDGQMGNSEVGHTNIGAGRVVYQNLVRIFRALKDGSFRENKVFRELVEYARKEDKPFHLMGLVSDGGVHSHIGHLKGILSILAEEGLKKVFVHVFTDGRDTDPHGALNYVHELEQHLKATTGAIASVTGRYYAMDRDNRWGRIRKAYDLLVHGIGKPCSSAEEAIKASYDEDITDEFIKPAVITDDGKPLATIKDGDAVLFFNFRSDRGRELTQVLTQSDNREYNMVRLDLNYATMTSYDDTFKGISVLFPKEDIREGLGEIIAAAGRKQIRIAETEKYPHVTFFFDGGLETPFEGEERFLLNSPRVATYDLQPEMSAYQIRDTIVAELEKGQADFVCLNFANPDMVGHTGVFEAAVKACETVDECTRDVVTKALEKGYVALVTADHGNADKMINPDGSPNTAHTTALVPFIVYDNRENWKVSDGILGDIAPTVLALMGIEKPSVMTGKNLLYRDA